MTAPLRRTAVIIGASSGIGEALAHQLSREGWRLGLLARRVDRLETMRNTLALDTVVHYMDIARDDATEIFESFAGELGGVDLVIISSGTGHLNPNLDTAPDID